MTTTARERFEAWVKPGKPGWSFAGREVPLLGWEYDLPMVQMRWEAFQEGVDFGDTEGRQAAEFTISAQEAVIETLRGALENIAAKFNQDHRDALESWKGKGTEAFEDPVWCEAASLKPLYEIANEALSTLPLSSIKRMAKDLCVRCELPREEHSYNGAAYGVCGQFTLDALAQDGKK